MLLTSLPRSVLYALRFFKMQLVCAMFTMQLTITLEEKNKKMHFNSTWASFLTADMAFMPL